MLRTIKHIHRLWYRIMKVVLLPFYVIRKDTYSTRLNTDEYTAFNKCTASFVVSNVVDGFATSQSMHVGDRWKVYIPYQSWAMVQPAITGI